MARATLIRPIVFNIGQVGQDAVEWHLLNHEAAAPTNENTLWRGNFARNIQALTANQFYLIERDSLVIEQPITADRITGITVNIQGTAYTNGSGRNIVTIPAPTGSGGQQATAVATVEGGKVVSIRLTNPGSGYDPNNPPMIMISPSDGSGTQATAEAFFGGPSEEFAKRSLRGALLDGVFIELFDASATPVSVSNRLSIPGLFHESSTAPTDDDRSVFWWWLR